MERPTAIIALIWLRGPYLCRLASAGVVAFKIVFAFRGCAGDLSDIVEALPPGRETRATTATATALLTLRLEQTGEDRARERQNDAHCYIKIAKQAVVLWLVNVPCIIRLTAPLTVVVVFYDIAGVTLADFLSRMSKESGKLMLAQDIIPFVTEFWEAGSCLQKSIIGVDVVGYREEVHPLVDREDTLNHLYIRLVQIGGLQVCACVLSG